MKRFFVENSVDHGLTKGGASGLISSFELGEKSNTGKLEQQRCSLKLPRTFRFAFDPHLGYITKFLNVTKSLIYQFSSELSMRAETTEDNILCWIVN